MSEHSNVSQNERIIRYLEKHGSITQLEALNVLGVMRLASRIANLKQQGYPIKGRFVTVKNRYDEDCRIKEYTLESGEDCG